MQEVTVPVVVTVTGFQVTSPEPEDEQRQDEATEAARAIASDIGMRLAGCGTSCIGGRVSVRFDGVSGASSD